MRQEDREFIVGLKCPMCKHKMVADVDIESMAVVKAYELFERALKEKREADKPEQEI